MRVFTDGACSHNGRPEAKAGYAVWFPENKEFSESGRVPDGQPQTNQRAELMGINRAVIVLDNRGFHDSDVVVYTDSEYSINCLTRWLTGWVARKWKTSAGTDVLHRDLIEDTSNRLAKFKSHRFVHVSAHTGKEDDISKNNDIVDKMARASIGTVSIETSSPAVDILFDGCPLRIMGPPVAQDQVITWVRNNLDTLPVEIVRKHLIKLFAEACKDRDVSLAKRTILRTPMILAERNHLQITHNTVETIE